MKNARLLAVLLALVAIFASLASGASAEALALQEDWIYRDGLLLATIDSSGTKYLHLDHLGTSRRITNSARAVIASHDYYPFGEEITASSQDSEALKFTGHERDLRDPTKTTDDLDYMHARFYNPWLGRFLSTDPIGGTPGAPQSWNRYSYVRNNPVNATDPDGKWLETAFDIGMAAVSIRQAWREPSFANIAGAALDVGAVVLPVVPAVAGRTIDAAQAADKLVDTARAADAVSDAATGGTYVLKHGDDVMRTGRTNDVSRRAGEHARHTDTRAFDFEPVHRTDDPAVRRGLEQMLHDQFNPPLDKINPISPTNPNRSTYMDAAEEFLGGGGTP